MLGARLLFSTLAALAIAACSSAASAQIADRCLAVSQAPRLIQPVALKKSEARLTFVGHSTWLIESAAGVRAATDYNDYVRPQVPLTKSPDPGPSYGLRRPPCGSRRRTARARYR